jgi:hypothetical protein
MFVFTIEDIIGLSVISAFAVLFLICKVSDITSNRRKKNKINKNNKGDL